MSKTLSEILSAASIEELHQLRDLVLHAEKLSTDDRIEGDYTDPSVDGPYLGGEIRKFGGNTFANLPRGEGPPYDEVVKDVADKLKADYGAGASVEDMESAIITKVFGVVWERMSETERREFIAGMSEAERQEFTAACGLTGKAWMGGVSAAALQAAFLARGFASYQILVIVVNAIVRQAIGVGLVASGLSLATNAALTRTAAVLVGPVGWAITGLITAIQVAGPSYKVTIPCVAFIAYLRRSQERGKYSVWETVTNTPMGPQKMTMTLATEGDVLAGTLVGQQGTIKIKEGKVKGDQLNWKADITSPMPMTLSFTATVDGDAISGNVGLGAFGNASFEGKRRRD